MNMRILVIGKNGQLGKSLHKLVEKRKDYDIFTFVGRQTLDFSDDANIKHYFEKNLFNIITLNFRKILLSFFLFLLISLPFIVLIFYSNIDYNERLGINNLDFEDKVFLIKHYFEKLTRFKSLSLYLLIYHYFLYLTKSTICLLNQLLSNKQLGKLYSGGRVGKPFVFVQSTKFLAVKQFCYYREIYNE